MTETSDLPSDPRDAGDTGDSSREEAGLAEGGAGVSSTGRIGNEFAPGGGDEVGISVDQELSGDGQRDDDLHG